MTGEQLPQLTEHQLKEKAIACDKVLTRNLFEVFFVLKEMYDYKLYIYLGYNSMEEYCQQRWDFARRTTFSYLQVAKKFLPIVADSNRVHDHALMSFSVEKLTILASLDASIVSELISKGEIKLGLKTYTIEDFKLMPVSDLRVLINGKTEPAEQNDDTVPFIKLYNQTEKYFNKIVGDVYKCPSIVKPDANKIEILIKQAALIFDKYKAHHEAMKKI